MKITIDLTQLSNQDVTELSSLLSNSIDYSVETEEMQNNYEASQDIEIFMSENNIT
jgi:hypothetical protein